MLSWNTRFEMTIIYFTFNCDCIEIIFVTTFQIGNHKMSGLSSMNNNKNKTKTRRAKYFVIDYILSIFGWSDYLISTHKHCIQSINITNVIALKTMKTK